MSYARAAVAAGRARKESTRQSLHSNILKTQLRQSTELRSVEIRAENIESMALNFTSLATGGRTSLTNKSSKVDIADSQHVIANPLLRPHRQVCWKSF